MCLHNMDKKYGEFETQYESTKLAIMGIEASMLLMFYSLKHNLVFPVKRNSKFKNIYIHENVKRQEGYLSKSFLLQW